MSNKSEIFVVTKTPLLPVRTVPDSPHRIRDVLEICVVLALILAAIWTPLGPLNSVLVAVASASVLAFAVRGRWSASEMGLTRLISGAAKILLIGGLFCALIALAGIPLRAVGPGYRVPWVQAAGYGIWSLQQEFILQSVFFLRFEALLGSRRAVLASAVVYALAHLPSPLLTGLSLLGGFLFCELFRRWRNLYPIGIIHGALGITIAASFPDKWMHHMRVGIRYLMH
jgi:hypothetical protein